MPKKKSIAKKKKTIVKKKVVAKKKPVVSKKVANKKKPAAKKAPPKRTAAPKTRALKKRPIRRASAPSPDEQGISRRARADSESVAELLDEGNTFEAGVVSGVERAEKSGAEVRTREFSEDDVPEEYLDNEP